MEALGARGPCMTAEYPLDGQDELSGYPLAKRLTNLRDIVCECELVTREEVERTVEAIGARYISDIQHRTRLGMGPCQAGSARTEPWASSTRWAASRRRGPWTC
jgi:glycerol-3-phosphate dehydrogenase